MMTFLQYEVPVLAKLLKLPTTIYVLIIDLDTFPLTSYPIHSFFSVGEGKGNLIFCCMGSRENYFGPVVWQNNNDDPIFQG